VLQSEMHLRGSSAITPEWLVKEPHWRQIKTDKIAACRSAARQPQFARSYSSLTPLVGHAKLVFGAAYSYAHALLPQLVCSQGVLGFRG